MLTNDDRKYILVFFLLTAALITVNTMTLSALVSSSADNLNANIEAAQCIKLGD